MEIFRVNRTMAPQARGVVIVIDVIRAFTVAGYAFARGAARLWLVRTIEEALALRAREPQALLTGEVQGHLIEGFDINNSPVRMATADVRGRLIIQRTGAGTQGAVLASNASHLLICAFTNAQATATYTRTLAASSGGVITLLPTSMVQMNRTVPHGLSLVRQPLMGFAAIFNSFKLLHSIPLKMSIAAHRNEDTLCADYIEALLRGRDDAVGILDKSIEQLHASGRFKLWERGHVDFPFADIPAILDVDRFNFAMVGTHKEWQGITYVDVQPVDVSDTYKRLRFYPYYDNTCAGLLPNFDDR